MAAPSPGTLEEPQVRAMFDRIAGFYDRMNSVMTAGLHHTWRRRAADLAAVGPGDRALDVACGTGDLAIELASRVGADGEVIGCDFSEEMLVHARRKSAEITWEWANALELPYESDRFDAATVGFGARNFSDLPRGIAEMVRVVKPGGRVVVLEITTPTKPPLSTFYRLWFDRVVPVIGRVAGDPDAYEIPAQLGQALPRAARPRRGARRGRPATRAMGPHRGRHHRDPRRGEARVTEVAPLDVGQLADVAGPQVGELLARVEERLLALGESAGPVLGPYARGTIAAGGKRLRPLLVLIAAGPQTARPGAERALVSAAVAVELVHGATLVHDDILDAATMRRGRPTVAAAAGRDIALATGDVLFAHAFGELSAGGTAAQVRVLSEASSALARGELLQREDAWDTSVSVQRYLARCELKTARLFEAACVLGPLAAQAAADGVAAALGAFGRRIGLAFQILDDVLDVTGPQERTGKRPGADLLDGTVTLPFILAREADPQLRALDPRTVTTPQRAQEVCDQIAASGALALSRERALELVADAKTRLPDGLDAGRRRALELVADGVVARYA